MELIQTNIPTLGRPPTKDTINRQREQQLDGIRTILKRLGSERSLLLPEREDRHSWARGL